jgi:N-acetylglutamate synthase-like GNAT family acetyltransferase
MHLLIPQSASDFERYYALRFEVLRKPWNQPLGSEKDELESSAQHIMVLDDQGNPAGVCRMQYNSASEAQIRFMGVREDMRGMGVGKKMLDYFESIARQKGITRIVLQARENALLFYKNNGYLETEKTFLLWGQIQHFRMEKELR